MADDGSVASVVRARIANCNWQMFKLSRFCFPFSIPNHLSALQHIPSIPKFRWLPTRFPLRVEGCCTETGLECQMLVVPQNLGAAKWFLYSENLWDETIFHNYFGMISIDILRIVELVLSTVIMHLWSIDLIMPSGRLQIAKAFHCGSSWRACEVGVGVLAAVKAVKERRWRSSLAECRNCPCLYCNLVTSKASSRA